MILFRDHRNCGLCIILNLALLTFLSFLSSCSKVSLINETAFVVPEKLKVKSAVAEAPRTVGELKSGDKVTVTDRAKAEDGNSWSKINGPEGQSGWVETKNLVKEEVVLQSRKLADEIVDIPVQALGKSKAQLKLRLSADRTSEDNVMTTLVSGKPLEWCARQASHPSSSRHRWT